MKLYDITMAPLQRKLIDVSMLNKREVSIHIFDYKSLAVTGTLEDISLNETHAFVCSLGSFFFYFYRSRFLFSTENLICQQIDWLNEFHQRIRENVTPLLQDNTDVINWLHKETEPIVSTHKMSQMQISTDDYNEVE